VRCSGCLRYRTAACLHNPSAIDFESAQPFTCFVPKQNSPMLSVGKSQESKWYFLKPNGRFSRSQFALFYFIPNLVTSALWAIIYFGIKSSPSSEGSLYWSAVIAGWLIWPCLVITIYLSIVAGIRRFHDLNKSGWYMLLLLIPLVWFVMLLYLLFTPGRTVDNRWMQ